MACLADCGLHRPPAQERKPRRCNKSPLHSQLAALLALPRSAPLSPPPSRERDASDRKPDTFPVINGKNKSTRFVVCWVDKQTTNSSATSPLLGARRRSGGCCSISPAAVTLRWAPSQPVPSQLRGSLRGSRRSDRGVWKAYGKAGWRCVCSWGWGVTPPRETYLDPNASFWIIPQAFARIRVAAAPGKLPPTPECPSRFGFEEGSGARSA